MRLFSSNEDIPAMDFPQMLFKFGKNSGCSYKTDVKK